MQQNNLIDDSINHDREVAIESVNQLLKNLRMSIDLLEKEFDEDETEYPKEELLARSVRHGDRIRALTDEYYALRRMGYQIDTWNGVAPWTIFERNKE